MPETVSEQHLKSVETHFIKIREFLWPRVEWTASGHCADAVRASHGVLVELAATALAQLEEAGAGFKAETVEVGNYWPEAPAEFKADQFARLTTMVNKMHRWFEQQVSLHYSETGAVILGNSALAMVQVIEACEAVMVNNRIPFDPYTPPGFPARIRAVATGDDGAAPPLEDSEPPPGHPDSPDYLKRICLKCGAPRVAGSEDCPNCGIVYERAEELHEQPDEVDETDGAAEPPDMAPLPNVPVKPEKPPEPTRLERLRQAVDDDIWIFIAFAVMAYLGVMICISLFVVGASPSVGAAKEVFADAAGERLLYPFDEGGVGFFVGRKVAILTRTDEQLMMCVYTEGTLAKKNDVGTIERTVLDLAEGMEFPFKAEREVGGIIGGIGVSSRVFGIEIEELPPMRAYMTSFTNSGGAPVLILFWGPVDQTRELAREVFHHE